MERPSWLMTVARIFQIYVGNYLKGENSTME